MIHRNYKFNPSSILYQYIDKLLSLLLEILRGILCKVYLSLDEVKSMN